MDLTNFSFLPLPFYHNLSPSSPRRVVERELNVPLPLAKIIKKWNNLLQEYKAIKMSEEPKRRDWPFFNMMDVYFSDQVNDPTLRLFSSTKTFGTDNLDDCDFKDSIGMSNAIAAANAITAQIKRENSLNREYNNNNRDTANNNNASSLDIADMMQDTKSIGSMDDDSVSLNLTTTNSNNSHISRMEHNNNNVAFSNNNYTNNNGGSAGGYADYDDVMMEPQAPLHQQPQNQHLHQQQHQKPHDPVPRQKDVSREELLQQAEHHNIDQYLLSWNNFYGNMCRGFHSLQKDEKMVDVTIAAGGKIFKAHKLVLSVCSPYFQKIFLEHPSNHPILFMTDVHSNYMAGLLDFMYSGQVNVKYEDLPNFLKVAEAMQIKGLHNESTATEAEPDSNNNKKDVKTNNNNNNSNNNNAKQSNLNFKQPSSPSPYMMDSYQQQQQQMLLATQQQQHFRNLMSSTPKPSPPLQRNAPAQPPISSTTPAPSAVAAAAAAAAALRSLNNASPFGNNGTGINCNRESPSQTSPKYQIHSTSKTMLDNTKHQKYFSKRKLSSIDAIADTISQSVASAVAGGVGGGGVGGGGGGNGNGEGESKRHKLLIHHTQHQEDINKNYKKLMMMASQNNNNNNNNNTTTNNNNNTDNDEDESMTTSTTTTTTSTTNNNGPSTNERQQSASPILDDQKIKMEPETQLDTSTTTTSSTTGPASGGNDEDEVYYADSPTSNSTLSAAAKLRHSILESHLRQNENSAFAGKLTFNRQTS